MKKAILGLILLAMVFATSCKKTSSSTSGPSANKWTFKGITYTPTSVYQNLTGGAGAGVLEVDDTMLAFGPSLYVYFPGNVLPTVGGTYTVVLTNYSLLNFSSSTAKEVGIISYIGGNAYYSTGGNGGNQTVSVSVSPIGKVTVSGSGIEMVYRNGNSITSDSAALSLNITQQ